MQLKHEVIVQVPEDGLIEANYTILEVNVINQLSSAWKHFKNVTIKNIRRLSWQIKLIPIFKLNIICAQTCFMCVPWETTRPPADLAMETYQVSEEHSEIPCCGPSEGWSRQGSCTCPHQRDAHSSIQVGEHSVGQTTRKKWESYKLSSSVGVWCTTEQQAEEGNRWRVLTQISRLPQKPNKVAPGKSVCRHLLKFSFSKVSSSDKFLTHLIENSIRQR